MSAPEHHQQVPVKVNAFRQFASQLAAQVTEQLCAEFEREVSIITEELVVYRTELARCGELLAHQLGREKQLHGMLENIAGNTGSLASSAAEVGQRHSASEQTKAQMHDMVEQMFGHSSTLLNSTVNGVNEAHSVAHSHLAQAKELQNQSLNAENELNRIMSILGAPPIQAQTPRTTSAPVPQVPQPQMFPGQVSSSMGGMPPQSAQSMPGGARTPVPSNGFPAPAQMIPGQPVQMMGPPGQPMVFQGGMGGPFAPTSPISRVSVVTSPNASGMPMSYA